jgi:hypothetical protein
MLTFSVPHERSRNMGVVSGAKCPMQATLGVLSPRLPATILRTRYVHSIRRRFSGAATLSVAPLRSTPSQRCECACSARIAWIGNRARKIAGSWEGCVLGASQRPRSDRPGWSSGRRPSGQRYSRSLSRIGRSLMHAKRRAMSPRSSNSQFSLPYERNQLPESSCHS